MKRTIRAAAVVLLVLLAVFVWRVVLPIVSYGFAINRVLAADREFLLKRVDHRAVALACLDMVTNSDFQSLIGQYPSGDDTRLPAAIRAVKPFWLGVSSNQVLIMKTGGHYHMGFVFRPSASDSNRYDLVFREEKDLEHDIPLHSVRKE